MAKRFEEPIPVELIMEFISKVDKLLPVYTISIIEHTYGIKRTFTKELKLTTPQ